MRRARIQVSDVILTLQELTIQHYETLSLDFTPEQLQHGHLGRLGKSVLIAAISEVDGRAADERKLRDRFKLSRDWALIGAVYARLIGMDSIKAQVARIAAGADRVTVTLSDGRDLVMVPLTTDQEEAIEIRSSAREPVITQHNKAAAGIVAFNGNKIDPALFDARAEIPLAADWALLTAVYQTINSPQSVPDFLPETQSSAST